MATQYPSKIDNNTSLPDAIDNLTPVKAVVVNRLKQAIIVIEEELGTKPSGIYASVKARLAAIETSISGLQSITLDGDLGGTLSVPLVIGLQGAPISDTPATVNQALVFNGLAWTPTTLASGTFDFTAGGDLSGSEINQTVIGLRGRTVSNTTPTDGYVLTWEASGTNWTPKPIIITDGYVSASAGIAYSKLGTGNQTIGAQQFTSTVDGYGTIIDVQPKNIQTTNDTVTTLDSFTIPSNRTLIVSAVITAIKSDNSQGAAYIRTAAFRNSAGSVAQISTTQDGGTFEDDATWDATIDNSTTTIRIRITGKAATTIRWTCVTTRLEVIA